MLAVIYTVFIVITLNIAGAASCASERYDSHSDNLDRGSPGGLQTVNHYAERTSYKQGSVLNREKKREVLIDDVVGSASSRVTSAFDSAVVEANGKRSDRDALRNNSLSGSGRSSLDSSQTERKTKVKSKQKNTRTISGSGVHGRFMESTDASGGSSQSAINVVNKKSGTTLPGNKPKPKPKPKQAEEGTTFGPLTELDSMKDLEASQDLGENQDLSSWLNFEEDGLMDHDSIGLEIPMDDLSDLNMLM